MTLIYVLKKHVTGLGRLTKVGMTVRSGDDRAKEYGGGGWECVKEYPVAVEEVLELKQIESRIHNELAEFRCHEAIGFGLTEVFTCSPNIAMAVVKEVVGNEPSMEDEARRLKKKVTKGVVSKFRKQYETAYANLIRDGEYKGKDGNSFPNKYRKFWIVDSRYLGQLRLCDDYLKLLNKSGGDDPIFRRMLEKERDEALDRLESKIAAQEKADERRKQLAEEENKKAAERSALAAKEKQRIKAKERQEQWDRERAEKAAKKEERRVHRKKRLKDLIWYVSIALLFFAFLYFGSR